jgi:hypothetical protein
VSGKPAFNIKAAFDIWLSGDFRMRRSLAHVHRKTITCGLRGQLTRGKIV